MGRGQDLLRRTALIAAGALALHELRYRIGWGEDAGAVAAEHGHAYLSWAAGAVVALLVAAGCAFVLSLLVEFRRQYGPAAGEAAPGSFPRAWLGASLALGFIYTLQELAEGWLAHGHPAGVEALAGHAGWSAYALAVVIGALVALALRSARGAIALAAARRRPLLPTARGRVPLPGPVAFDVRPRTSVLALNAAGRAPPTSC